MVEKIVVKKLLVAGNRLVRTGLCGGRNKSHSNRLLSLKRLCSGRVLLLFVRQAYPNQHGMFQRMCKVRLIYGGRITNARRQRVLFQKGRLPGR